MASVAATLPKAGCLQPSFKEQLSGPHAFYHKSDYKAATKRIFSQAGALPAIYTWNTEHKITRLAKRVFSWIVFPIALYDFLHAVGGWGGILPSSVPSLMGLPRNFAEQIRADVSLDGEWKYQRFCIEVDGIIVDAMLMGKPSTFHNGRWVLASNGNGQFYEGYTYDEGFQSLLSSLGANAVAFNYPGVGASTGWPNRYAMAKAYRALLTFLADEKAGVGAQEIIGYGHSIGGGVQGDALDGFSLSSRVKYVFVKSRTFSDLSSIVSDLIAKVAGGVVKVLGWNMGSLRSSKMLQVPEIILQTAHVGSYQALTDSAPVVNDGIVTPTASLAKALLDDVECPKHNKLIVGIPDMHNDRLSNMNYLAMKIEDFLKR